MSKLFVTATLDANGNLDLRRAVDTSGDVDLSGTDITALPDNLRVGGNLDLFDTLITTLPNNLKVGGNLDLRRTPITTLPDNLVVGGHLDLRRTSITALPDTLKVGGNLDMFVTSGLKVPEHFSVGGVFRLHNVKSYSQVPAHLRKRGNGRPRFTIKNEPDPPFDGPYTYVAWDTDPRCKYIAPEDRPKRPDRPAAPRPSARRNPKRGFGDS
jgi:hypothetical protein